MDHSSWDAKRFSDTHKIPDVLWTRTAHSRVNNSPQFILIRSQIHPINAFPSRNNVPPSTDLSHTRSVHFSYSH